MDFGAHGRRWRSDRTSSRISDGVDRVAADTVEAGGAAIGIVCEMGEIDQITAAVDQVVAAYGRIDILVNNAFDRSAVRLRGSHRGQRS
nr:SDR family NAD(P)-dependent oxidoreductase [Sinorhizobium meliloti]